MIALMYRVGLKVGQVLALERYHYESGAHVITVPGTQGGPERIAAIDAVTHELLNHWLAVRRTVGLSKMAPLFPTLMEGQRGKPLRGVYVRQMLADAAAKAGIEKRVTPSGLKKTYEVSVAERTSRLVAHMAAHIDEPAFGTRYPLAYEKWRAAFDLFEIGAERNAARIGIDCRGAATAFVIELAAAHKVDVPDGSPIAAASIRAILRSAGDRSSRVDAFLDALVKYWGSVMGLVNRQVHEAEAAPGTIRHEDARRALFQTMLVMHEIDSALGQQR
jgi:hypothetical protein